MHMSTLVVALLTAICVWVLLVRKLTAKPWLSVANSDELNDIGPIIDPAARIGLKVFLVSITSLFALFITGYTMRMDPAHASDWSSISKPLILWLNTAVLMLASVAMQWARYAEQKGSLEKLKLGLVASGVLTLMFLVGQLIAWQEIKTSDYFDIRNPAVAFFYLLTGLHGLHLVGGLYVWLKATVRIWSSKGIDKCILSIELCTTYWHYLLLVWFVLFGLLLST